ncbi:MAG: protein-tyrosine-phosphatase [Bacteroidota bacterium]
MNQKLEQYIAELDLSQISEPRKDVLGQIANYVKNSPNPKLNFICTHNSRRSHLSQIWAQTFADRFGITLKTFSGGTEATAFNPNAVSAIRRAGFNVEAEGDQNPRYSVSHSEDEAPMVCYSKKFEEEPNPTSGFAAIMTCSEADAECPVVFGADERIKLFYEDPKISDGTPEEAKTYDARCKQIATELFYVFSSINN